MSRYYAHPTAVIDEGCTIGRGTKIWHFSHIMTGCSIGEDCVIGQNVLVATGVVLGNRVKVQNNVSLYTGINCEDDVFFGPSSVFTNVKNPRSAVNRKSQFKQTLIRKGVTVGANATVICGNELGVYAFIGAGSVVTRAIPAYGLVTGNPAVLRGWMSRVGCRLQFDAAGRAFCSESGEEYQVKDNVVTRVDQE